MISLLLWLISGGFFPLCKTTDGPYHALARVAPDLFHRMGVMIPVAYLACQFHQVHMDLSMINRNTATCFSDLYWTCRRTFWLRLFVLPAVMLAIATAANAATSKQDFPRLSGLQIGLSPYAEGIDDPEYQQKVARLDLAVLGETSKSVIGVAENIRKMNPGIIIGNYNNLSEIQSKRQGYFTQPIQKMNNEKGPNNTTAPDWWLHDKNGNIIAHATHPNRWRTNLTDYVKPDANGDRYPEWKAKYDASWIMGAPVWDFWYQDVVNWKPKFQSRGFIGDYSGGKTFNEGCAKCSISTRP